MQLFAVGLANHLPDIDLLPHEYVEQRLVLRQVLGLDPQTRGRIPLPIQVHNEHLILDARAGFAEVDRSHRFCASAFLIGDGDDPPVPLAR